MKTLVIYKSKTGYTRKYAEYIEQELSADLCELSKATEEMLMTYDTVIFGGGLYVIGINGVKFITENLDKLKNKKVVVFATGASPLSEAVINIVKNKNFTPEQQKLIQFFYLRGGFDYSKLNLYDKFLMNLLKLKIKTKKKLNSDEKGMLAIYNKPTDYTRKRDIDKIIAYVNSN